MIKSAQNIYGNNILKNRLRKMENHKIIQREVKSHLKNSKAMLPLPHHHNQFCFLQLVEKSITIIQFRANYDIKLCSDIINLLFPFMPRTISYF